MYALQKLPGSKLLSESDLDCTPQQVTDLSHPACRWPCQRLLATLLCTICFVLTATLHTYDFRHAACAVPDLDLSSTASASKWPVCCMACSVLLHSLAQISLHQALFACAPHCHTHGLLAGTRCLGASWQPCFPASCCCPTYARRP